MIPLENDTILHFVFVVTHPVSNTHCISQFQHCFMNLVFGESLTQFYVFNSETDDFQTVDSVRHLL